MFPCCSYLVGTTRDAEVLVSVSCSVQVGYSVV